MRIVCLLQTPPRPIYQHFCQPLKPACLGDPIGHREPAVVQVFLEDWQELLSEYSLYIGKRMYLLGVYNVGRFQKSSFGCDRFVRCNLQVPRS